MLPRVLESTTAADLQILIDLKVLEDKTIDYKKILHHFDAPDANFKKKEHVEFLKDVSSFANTAGGDLVIGMDEDKGVPLDMVGIKIDDFDKLKLRLSALLDQWVQPRIGYAFHQVPVAGGNHVLIIRVPKSLLAPHRVVYCNEPGQFYARQPAGTYAMDTTELRRAFTLTETIADKIARFARDRVAGIAHGAGSALMSDCPKLILHLIPLESFAGRLSFSAADLKKASSSVEPLRSTSRSTRVNLDGVVISTSNRHSPDATEYVQVFRNGIIEIVCGDTIYTYDNDPKSPRLFYTHNEHHLVTKLPVYLETLKALGIPLPLYAFLTLQNVKGVSIQRKGSHDLQTPFDRETLALPDAQIDDYSVKPLDLFMPLFDMIWNAAGYDKCHSFDASGNWVNSH